MPSFSRPVAALPAHAELHCRCNFSFLTGASPAEQRVAGAHALGYGALAITEGLASKSRDFHGALQPCGERWKMAR